jgi:hypothetical protein
MVEKNRRLRFRLVIKPQLRRALYPRQILPRREVCREAGNLRSLFPVSGIFPGFLRCYLGRGRVFPCFHF